MHGIERHQQIHGPSCVERPARHVAEVDDVRDALRADIGDDGFEREVIAVDVGDGGEAQVHIGIVPRMRRRAQAVRC